MQNKSWLSSAFAGGVLLLAGCQAEVGTDYRGEALLSLKGSVVLDDQSMADQVPVLAFYSQSGFALLDVHVEGEFPSRFNLEVFEPPPQAAMTDPETGTVSGFLTVVPKDHPSLVQAVSVGDYGMCSADGTACTEQLNLCIMGGGICLQRELSCASQECPVVGDVPIPPDQVTCQGYAESGGTDLMTLDEQCNAAGQCDRLFRKCGLPNAYSSFAEFGRELSCEVVSESGDERVKAFDSVYESALQSAVGYDVVYSARAQESSPYGPLRAGYSLFKTIEPDSDQAWMDSLLCRCDTPQSTTCPPGVHKELVSPDEELTFRIGYRRGPAH